MYPRVEYSRWLLYHYIYYLLTPLPTGSMREAADHLLLDETVGGLDHRVTVRVALARQGRGDGEHIEHHLIFCLPNSLPPYLYETPR